MDTNPTQQEIQALRAAQLQKMLDERVRREQELRNIRDDETVKLAALRRSLAENM